MHFLIVTGLSLSSLLTAYPSLTSSSFIRVQSLSQNLDSLLPQSAPAAESSATESSPQAEIFWQRLVGLDPDNAFAYESLGWALHQQGRFTRAERAFRQALALAPSSSAYYGLGKSIEGVSATFGVDSRADEAETAYREAIRLDPENVNIYWALGQNLDAQGRPSEAAAFYRQTIRLDSSNPQAYWALANAIQVQGKSQEAEAVLQEAIRLIPHEAATYSNLGYLYQLQGRFEEAIELYGQALNIDPRNLAVQAKLAEVERLISAPATASPAMTVPVVAP